MERLGDAGFRLVIGMTRIIRKPDGAEKYDFLPAHRWANQVAPDTREGARELFRKYPRADRVAIATGPCRALPEDEELIGIDIDVGHGNGADGFKSLRAMLDELGINFLPLGPRWHTPRGGLHMLFRIERGIALDPAPAPGVEIKQANRLLTCPPTVRPDGAYTWLKGCAPWELFTPRPPAKFVERVRKPEPKPAPPAMPYTPPADDKEAVRRRAYVERALQGEASDLALTAEGGRNHALKDAARRMANFVAGEPDVLRADEVRDALRAACVSNGLIADRGEPAFAKSFDSGFKFGLKFERRVPAPTKRPPPRSQGR